MIRGKYKLGEKVGTWYKWYDSGKQKSAETYPDGKGISWFENGDKSSEWTLKNGLVDGVRIEWYTSDEVKKAHDLETDSLFADRGINPVGNSLVETLKMFRHSPQEREVSHFTMGVLNGLKTTFSPTGQKMSEGGYRDGVPVGVHTFWDGEREFYETYPP